jgi:hypothetical protein
MKRLHSLALILTAVMGCDSGSTSSGNDLAVPADLTMMTSNNDDLTMMSSCGAPNAACTVGVANGLCKVGTCSPCTDTTDDATCVTAYGAGNICAGGSCIMGCHDSSTCAGKICDPGSNTCRGCSQDADCPGSAPYCNTANGTCGAAPPACTTGTACNGGSGFCCASVCLTGAQCCGNPDCTGAGQTCDTTSHTCVNTTNCTDAPSGTKFYVNPTPAPGFSGKGTKQCPFTSLTTAVQAAPSPAPITGFTICTEGTFDSSSTNAWPHHLNTNIEFDGTYCGDNTTHTLFTVPSAQPAVYANNAGGPATAIHGYDIISAFGDNPNKLNSGIYVANTGTSPTNPGTTPVKIYDVTIKYFARGIYVSTATGNAGSAAIIDNVQAQHNGTGLKVDNGAKVVITSMVNDGTKATTFQNNDAYGIQVVDGTLTAMGMSTTGASNETQIRCGSNTSDGIYINNAKAKVTLDKVHSSQNMAQGISMLNTATVKVTNSVFNNNMLHGIHIWQDPSQTSNQSVATLNFGTDSGANAGLNLIQSNTDAGIRIDFYNSDALNAEGNNFGAHKNCAAGQDQTGKVSVSPVCASKPYDLCGPTGGNTSSLTFANVMDCQKCACDSTTNACHSDPTICPQ